MSRLVVALLFALLGLLPVSAQTLDGGKVQFHGFATQGLIYSTHNNWNTTDSSDGSLAWTEAVLNVSYQPMAKLRFGIQPRYFRLGRFGNDVRFDWIQADLKLNDHFGVRGGKVKTPAGLLNEVQDIDPSYPWILLPQSIYPLASRNAILSHDGGVVYGKVRLGETHGEFSYHAYGGRRSLASDDGFLQVYRDNGLNLPNGIAGPTYGGTLAWSLPAKGLLVGASAIVEHESGPVTAGPLQGTLQNGPFHLPFYFARYENRKFMVAGEYNRLTLHSVTTLTDVPAMDFPIDQRLWYVMATYRPKSKLVLGIYYSSSVDLKVPQSMDRYQKDWTLTGRYDFNGFLYAKVEEHVMDGTLLGFSTSDNPNGLSPNTRMTLAKIGVSF